MLADIFVFENVCHGLRLLLFFTLSHCCMRHFSCVLCMAKSLLICFWAIVIEHVSASFLLCLITHECDVRLYHFGGVRRRLQMLVFGLIVCVRRFIWALNVPLSVWCYALTRTFLSAAYNSKAFFASIVSSADAVFCRCAMLRRDAWST